jgi:hypothetical protein
VRCWHKGAVWQFNGAGFCGNRAAIRDNGARFRFKGAGFCGNGVSIQNDGVSPQINGFALKSLKTGLYLQISRIFAEHPQPSTIN